MPKKRTLPELLKGSDPAAAARLLSRRAPEKRKAQFQIPGGGLRRMAGIEAVARRSTESSRQRAAAKHGIAVPSEADLSAFRAAYKPKGYTAPTTTTTTPARPGTLDQRIRALRQRRVAAQASGAGNAASLLARERRLRQRRRALA